MFDIMWLCSDSMPFILTTKKSFWEKVKAVCFRHATSAPVSSPQELFARLGRPPPPRLPFPLPLPQALFPRIQAPFPPDVSPPGGARGPPQGAPSPFPPGFIHPFSQSFPGRPFPFPGSGLPPHPFLPNFKHEREADAGKATSGKYVCLCHMSRHW